MLQSVVSLFLPLINIFDYWLKNANSQPWSKNRPKPSCAKDVTTRKFLAVIIIVVVVVVNLELSGRWSLTPPSCSVKFFQVQSGSALVASLRTKLWYRQPTLCVAFLLCSFHPEYQKTAFWPFNCHSFCIIVLTLLSLSLHHFLEQTQGSFWLRLCV